MDVEEHLIFLRNKDQTRNIEACTFNNEKWNIKFYGNSKVYTYNSNNVIYETNPVKIDARMNTVYQDDQPITGVTQIVQFKTYTRLNFETGYSAVYRNSSIHIEQTSLNKNNTRQVFKYLSILANNVNETIDEQPSFLGKLYQNLKHISPRSVLSHYLSGKPPISRTNKRELIFPFGFNMSQKAATEKAYTEQVSIIEGPPGTGKTQTILNIIANAIIRNETVAVVSNNNSATANVLEKLQQYDLDFFAAYLGNKENQESFFENQTGLYPKMTHWHLEEQKYQSIKTELEHSLLELDKMLELKNSQAKLKQQLTDFQTEYRYFEDYMKNFSKNQFQFKSITRLTSDRLLRLLIRFTGIFKGGKIKLRNKLYNLFVYRIFNFGIYKLNPEKIIILLQDTYYNTKMTELEDEINDIETKLHNYHFEENMKAQSKNSMKLLKATLAKTYDKTDRQTIFHKNDLWKNFDQFIKQYPVILSTTHSLRNSSAKNYLFDFVLIDESSQVDIVTGALALSCAKNAVIVGDLMQLPHVVSKEIKDRTDKIFDSFQLNTAYHYSEQNLLSSIHSLFPNTAKTLLKEHYRSHPAIIGFCNQKFYNNELVILTDEFDVEMPLILYETVEGNHARGKINERQGDVIYHEIIPEQQINPTKQSVGIIAPFRDQANMLQATKTNDAIEADTVHKYQGQEKDVIILSTVSNRIKENDFVDHTNLINVAVSRAVKQLIVVVSAGSKAWYGTNIGDLVRYVRYNNFEVVESEVRSVFDLLYMSYSEQLLKVINKHKKVSAYNSENLMNIVIEKVLDEPEFQSLRHVLHQPLRMLIQDPNKLTEEEHTYAMNVLTHTDFVIYYKIDKRPLLVIEVDGHAFHADNPAQIRRDEMKNRILQKYHIPIIRMKTTGSEEEGVLRNRLREVMSMQGI